MTTINHKDFAKEADNNDLLRKFRNEFFISTDQTIYLDGNSLGRLPKHSNELISDVTIKQWGTELIESWNKQWYNKPVKIGDKIANIVGALPGEVIVSDSTSLNLYKLAHAALKFQKGKTTVVSDELNFPTDLYILQGLIKEFGPDYKLELAHSADGISITTDEIKSKIDENTALVVLSLVAFKSAFMYNIAEITAYARKMGALVLWDLSHAAGAVKINLTENEVDLAVGCTYKYLNGGPGSPAFLYIKKELQDKLSTPIQGWFGDASPFEFDLKYRPARGIRKFLTGTPPVLNLMAIEPGVEMINAAGINNIHAKSIQLSDFFISMLNSELLQLGFILGSPADSSKRGSHISLKHVEAYRICQALIHPKKSQTKIIPDFREPDNIRFGFTPLYTTFTEVYKTVQRLKEIMISKEFEDFSNLRSEVT